MAGVSSDEPAKPKLSVGFAEVAGAAVMGGSSALVGLEIALRQNYDKLTETAKHEWDAGDIDDDLFSEVIPSAGQAIGIGMATLGVASLSALAIHAYRESKAEKNHANTHHESSEQRPLPHIHAAQPDNTVAIPSKNLIER